MINKHEHYDKLTESEKAFADDVFHEAFREAKAQGIPLMGDDRAEVAVDALAKLIIESRPPGTLAMPWTVVEELKASGRFAEDSEALRAPSNRGMAG